MLAALGQLEATMKLIRSNGRQLEVRDCGPVLLRLAARDVPLPVVDAIEDDERARERLRAADRERTVQEDRSMRLTKHMRGVIATRMLDRTFKDRLARLAERDSVLAMRVIVAAYGPDVWVQIASIPLGWLPKLKDVHFSLGERNYRTTFAEYRSIPNDAVCARLSLALAGNEAILDELHEIEAERCAIRAQRGQLKAEIYAVLNSVTTVDRLGEVWPEGLTELPPEWLAPKSVPAPLVEDLNKRIAVLREAA